MNELKVQQAGGFPMETDTLDFMQTAYDIFNALGELAGNLAIVSGCEAVGSQITNGTVYINGELLEFRGGAVGTNVIIRQESTTRTFEDGNSKDVYQTRYATFGTGITMYPWADFKRISNLQELKKKADELRTTIDSLKTKIVPIGAIIMWAGAYNRIPAGWYLCNGYNGTPDLRSKFIVGAGSKYNVGNTGGADSVTLTADQCATRDHSHTMFKPGIASRSTPIIGSSSYSVYNRYYTKKDDAYNMKSAGSSEPTVGKTSTVRGRTANSHENRPPYYALAFIQFKGDN